MLNIAICDNSLKDIERFESFMEQITLIHYDYDVFYSGKELLTYVQKTQTKYNMYILDIEMEEINGIELAKKIRDYEVNALIVFLTNHKGYVYNVFDVVTFDYLIKPIYYEMLDKLLNKALHYLTYKKNYFHFSYRKNLFCIECSSIIFIEKNGRQALIHTTKEIYRCNITTIDLWKQLESLRFTHIHNSFIINLQFLSTIEKDYISLTTGECLHTSRKYRKELKEKHLSYIKEFI